MADNNTADVSSIKGVHGGYGFSAPISTTPPTDFTALDAAFGNMGFISADGIEETIDVDSDEIPDLNGDVVATLVSKETEKLTFTLISTTEEALKEMHGHENVVTTNGVTTVTHKVDPFTERVYVFDLLMKNNLKLRKVAPNAKVTNRGPIVHASNNLYGREIELTCSPDANGARIIDYIQRS